MEDKSSRKGFAVPGIEFNPTEAILESISDGVFTVSGDWLITSFNRAAEEITGVRREDAAGKRCSEVFRASMCETNCALRKTFETGKPVINRSAFIINADGQRIPISVSTALLYDETGNVVGGAETFRDLSLVEELRKELESRFHVGDLISRSESMRKIFTIVPQVADSTSTVLIQGETGTGKELLARAIHNLSARSEKPFVAVNCGALPDTLLESELFGYKAGAFTGAVKDKPGRFTLAEGGTILLDEIGDISQALQVRLLRILQEKTFEPLGDVTTRTADVRVIAATNKDLPELVERNRFREDLFYRINVVNIELPPLRKRKEDIPMLVDHFLKRFNRIQDKSVSGVNPEVLATLMAHDYPGNVRELENIIEYSFVLCSSGLLEPEHLPKNMRVHAPPLESSENMKKTVRTVEARVIQDVLKRNNFNRLATAAELGIHKSTLFRKMKKLGLDLPEKDGRSSGKD